MRVVLVRLSALGDVVHTWPLATALRAQQPEMHLTWVVERPFVQLVRAHPAVDHVLACSTRRWRKSPMAAATRAEVDMLKTQLHELAPDICLDPQGVLKSALVTRWSRADRRIGLAKPWRRELLPGLVYTECLDGCRQHEHVVATNLEMVRALGGEPPAAPPAPDGSWLLDSIGTGRTTGTDDVEDATRQRLAGTPEMSGIIGSLAQRTAVMLPAAGQEDKILPVSTLAETARELVGSGLGVVVAWGPGEKERASAIVDLAGSGTTLAPPTDILQLAVILAEAAVVIGGDTGPVHLAASLGAPTLAVFLTTDSARNGPLGACTAVLSAARKTGHRPTGSARARQVRKIDAAEILDATHQLLERRTKQTPGSP